MTGVVVVSTARADGGWAAVTVNSFTSVSLDPPLVLWCLASSSNCRAHFERAERFAVSVLRHDQQGISSNFARPSSSTWANVPVHCTPEGDLLIRGALASFQCTVAARQRAGDHAMFTGRVERYSVGESAHPLGFFEGSYGSFTRDQSEIPAVGCLFDAEAQDATLGWG